MTDARLDGDFLPEVRRFRESAPHAQQGWDDADDARIAAMAAAAASQRRRDEDMLFDVS